MTSIQATKIAMSADSAIVAKQKLTRRSPTRKGRSEIQLKDMKSRMKPVTVRDYGSFPKHKYAISCKGSRSDVFQK